MKYYIHTKNHTYKASTVDELYMYTLNIFKATREYQEDECIKIAEAVKAWAKVAECPGQDRLELNGLVITTERI